MTHIRTHLRRSLALLALPALAACGAAEGAANAEAPTLAGMYTGSMGTLAYRLEIPEGKTSPIAVHGTVTDARGTSEVHGTAVYQHPAISFELVKVSQDEESVFGISGTVSESRHEISIPRGDKTLTLRHEQ